MRDNGRLGLLGLLAAGLLVSTTGCVSGGSHGPGYSTGVAGSGYGSYGYAPSYAHTHGYGCGHGYGSGYGYGYGYGGHHYRGHHSGRGHHRYRRHSGASVGFHLD